MILISIFSDYKCGALTDEQFENECRRMNRRDRIEREELDGLNIDTLALDDWFDEEDEE